MTTGGSFGADVMKALDLFAGAGGATRGLQMAGLAVTAVDIAPQPHNPADRFIQADVLKLTPEFIRGFALIWASPPCQRYTSLRHAPGEHRDADLIERTRKLLIASGKPYVIENVEGARAWLRDPALLCGSMFDLETPTVASSFSVTACSKRASRSWSRSVSTAGDRPSASTAAISATGDAKRAATTARDRTCRASTASRRWGSIGR